MFLLAVSCLKVGFHMALTCPADCVSKQTCPQIKSVEETLWYAIMIQKSHASHRSSISFLTEGMSGPDPKWL